MRILITGPESSGKTTLARAFANSIDALLIPELARPYLTLSEGKYTLTDLQKLADQQKALEDLYRPLSHSHAVFDTGAIVLKIWATEVFGENLEPVEITTRYDIVLLCQPDIPWEPDRLRMNPDDRMRLAKLYENVLTQSEVPWTTINGTHEHRLSQAIQFFQQNKL